MQETSESNIATHTPGSNSVYVCHIRGCGAAREEKGGRVQSVKKWNGMKECQERERDREKRWSEVCRCCCGISSWNSLQWRNLRMNVLWKKYGQMWRNQKYWKRYVDEKEAKAVGKTSLWEKKGKVLTPRKKRSIINYTAKESVWNNRILLFQMQMSAFGNCLWNPKILDRYNWEEKRRHREWEHGEE